MNSDTCLKAEKGGLYFLSTLTGAFQMTPFSFPLVLACALLLFASPAIAGKFCKDGVTPKTSGCPLDFSEQRVAFDNFDEGVDGWSQPSISDVICGSDPMLVLAANGGTPSSKVYDALPEHNHVRVQASVNFFDDWQLESAAIALDGQVIWTEQHDQQAIAGAVDLCGSAIYPESKLGVPIDITVPHTASSVELEIFTTLPGGAEAGIALDDVRVSVFTYEP